MSRDSGADSRARRACRGLPPPPADYDDDTEVSLVRPVRPPPPPRLRLVPAPPPALSPLDRLRDDALGLRVSALHLRYLATTPGPDPILPGMTDFVLEQLVELEELCDAADALLCRAGDEAGRQLAGPLGALFAEGEGLAERLEDLLLGRLDRIKNRR